ncbi:MAG: ABC transporter permease [Gammaproteobacteria bacterium]
MISAIRNLAAYRELILMLAWRNIAVQYKQAYLGIAWAVLKPLMLMLIFTIVRSFVGIDSGNIPYPILTFAALLPWTFFQEAVTGGVVSVVGNSSLVKKIYFPREIFPITASVGKLVELAINFVILAGMMVYYQMAPTIYAFWVPLFILYTVVVVLAVSLAGAALNVYYRDVRSAVPVLLSLLMYVSPVMYPISLVQKKLVVDQAAGSWSDLLYKVYTVNPMTGIIDGFQRALLHGQQPDFAVIWPGLIATAVVLPLSYLYFKRAEGDFADVI